jgi:hypothetical protein
MSWQLALVHSAFKNPSTLIPSVKGTGSSVRSSDITTRSLLPCRLV